MSNTQAGEAQVLAIVAADVLEEVLQYINGDDVAAKKKRYKKGDSSGGRSINKQTKRKIDMEGWWKTNEG